MIVKFSDEVAIDVNKVCAFRIELNYIDAKPNYAIYAKFNNMKESIYFNKRKEVCSLRLHLYLCLINEYRNRGFIYITNEINSFFNELIEEFEKRLEEESDTDSIMDYYNSIIEDYVSSTQL